MIRVILLLCALTLTSSAFAGFSPKSESEIYNQGVDLMMDLKFKKAEKKFRAALEADDNFGEAHNNLAYCLRKQGSENYGEAMAHYNKSIELLPEAPQPYMYRGVLYVSMGDKEYALADHAKLLELGATELAGELEWVISNGKEKDPEQFFGVFDREEE